jgi:phage/conjugal plasmid C-4 type zinc finger TraR family protein
MADNADIANEVIEIHIKKVLATWPERVEIRGVVLLECEDCGNEIPAARRQAAPWATTCIECQGIREQQAKHRR